MAAAQTLTVMERLDKLLAGAQLIVVCGRSDDATAWTNAFGSQRCLALSLDKAASKAHAAMPRNESGRLAFHHEALAGLDGTGWLAGAADAFDAHQQAVLIAPDPLDPPRAGSRRRLGQRPRMWQLCEDKAVIDVIWDRLGVPRPRSVIADGTQDLAALGSLVDVEHGVVCAVQRIGAPPTSGAEGIWWWQRAAAPLIGAGPQHRVKVMPLVPGLPVRLHGMVFVDAAVAFPPMEIVALPRTDTGTFLCCGAVGVLPDSAELRALTERIGAGLSSILGYRGAYSVDGILSQTGFLPTDLNTRLTSAMEAAPPDVRMQLQAANVLAREGVTLTGGNWIDSLAAQAFDERTVTVYGASPVAEAASMELAVRWDGDELRQTDHPAEADGWLSLAPSLRGWTLTARLLRRRLPNSRYVGDHAPAIFRFADRSFGTTFGALDTPFGMGQPVVPHPR
jgi:hypothetical protein